MRRATRESPCARPRRPRCGQFAEVAFALTGYSLTGTINDIAVVRRIADAVPPSLHRDGPACRTAAA
jgi:hypothetical protein